MLEQLVVRLELTSCPDGMVYYPIAEGAYKSRYRSLMWHPIPLSYILSSILIADLSYAALNGNQQENPYKIKVSQSQSAVAQKTCC